MIRCILTKRFVYSFSPAHNRWRWTVEEGDSLWWALFQIAITALLLWRALR